MVLFNYSTKELTAKIVFYGPGLCGKTTNLQYIHQNLPQDAKGKMLSLATKTDRTLFFDFLPIDLGSIRGMKTRVQLYTVPGQVFYNETRKLVLKGADGIVFVADSQEQMLGANVESFRNLEDNLRGHGMKLAEMPHVLQFNKRDLPKLSNIEELNSSLNKYNAPFYESVATTGIGVQDTLKAIVKLVLLHLTRKYDPAAAAVTTPAPGPTPQPASTAAPPADAPTAQPGQTQGPPPVPVASPTTPEPTAPSAIMSGPAAPTDGIPLSDIGPTPDVAAPSPETRPIEAPRSEASPPPPPDFRGGPGDLDLGEGRAPQFGDDEIDDLVDEVSDLDDGDAFELPVEPAIESEPLAATPATFDDPIAEPEPTVDEPVFDPAATAWTAEAPDLDPPPVQAAPESPMGGGAEGSGVQEISAEQFPGIFAPPAESSPEEIEDPMAVTADETEIEFHEPPGDDAPMTGFSTETAPHEDGPIVDDAPVVSEVPEIVPEPAAETAPGSGSGLEIDRGFDPEWSLDDAPTGNDNPVDTASPFAAPVEPTEPTSSSDEPAAPETAAPAIEQPTPEAAAVAPVDPVVLTEVAEDDDLFRDPDVEVLQLQPGQPREIAVPVQVGEGPNAKRFKLTVRVNIDSTD
jgi:signal recognition particle receptor subunit beta